jgi:hypothetical protein
MSRKQFVCAANLGFPVRPCGFIHFSHSFDLQSGNLYHISFIHHGPCYCSKTKAWHWDTVQCMWKTVCDIIMICVRSASWSGYLIGTGCHVLDDGSTRSLLVATARPNMSTAMLQKLKMKPKHHCMIPRHFGNEISTLSNSLWKNYLDDLDCIDHL